MAGYLIGRMENFENDCCHPWTKNPFRNLYSGNLGIANAVVYTLIACRWD